MRTVPTKRELDFLAGLAETDGFRGKVEALRAEIDLWCADGPLYVRLADGRRSSADQFEKWKVGRHLVSPDPAPWGTWELDEGGKFVTRAPPGSSAHEVGLAADFGIIDSRGTAKTADDRWVPSYVHRPDGSVVVHEAWLELGRRAKALGLQTGLHWRKPWDFGHVEHPLWQKLGRAAG